MMKMLVLVLLAYCSYVAAIECESSEISCQTEERCIIQRYICDKDDDCNDGSDEDLTLCSAWRNDECARNEVRCTRNGDTNCIDISSYCLEEDNPCEGDLDPRICKMLENGVLENLDNIIIQQFIEPGNLQKAKELANKFNELVPYTLQHINCPPMYTLVGDQCLSIFHIGSMSWGESREFCRILNGDLITFKNISHFAAVVQHLQKFELTANFWIGGWLENVTEGWTWVDGTPMETGSPFWATRYSSKCVERNVTVAESDEVCFHYYQAPEPEPLGQCVSLSFEQFFYMGDDDCIKKMSPLCVYQGPDDGPRKPFVP